MSDQEINIAIAEACGWKFDDSMEMWLSPNDIHFFPWQLPDYCNDLNAMHEAEKVVASQCKEHDYWFFVRQLMGFPDAECDWDEVLHFNAIHATARQRAEAFLRTIGKWEEEVK